jgi:hypothetical protein
MTELQLFDIIRDAMKAHGADGLFNQQGPCGCGLNDLSPGNCLSANCVLARGVELAEDGDHDEHRPGGTIYFPIQFEGGKAVVG